MLQRCGDWIGALLDFPGFVDDEVEPYRPVAVVWFEPSTGLIVDSELVKPIDALPRAAGLFHLATREPKAGEPRLPRRIRVADAAFGSALRGLVGDVEVIVGPTPEISEVLASMREFFTRRNRETTGAGDDDDAFSGRLSYLHGDVTEKSVARFFAVAAVFYRAAPWGAIPPDGPLAIKCDALDIEEGIAVVVGQMGQSFGVSIYFSRADAGKMLVAADEVQSRGSLTGVEDLPRHIMVSFDDDIEPALLREIAEHGWQVAGPSAYPRAALIEPDLVSRPLTAHELAGVTAILAAIASVTTDERAAVIEAFGGGPGVRQDCEITVGDRSVHVELVAPGNCDFDDDPLAWQSFEDFDESDLDAAIHVYCDALADELELDPESDEADRACMLVDVAARFYHQPLLGLFPVQLRHFLAKTIPKHVAIDAGEADLIFDLLVRAFDMAARRYASEPGIANCLRLLSPKARIKLAADLSDESKFSRTKQITMRAVELGIDPRSPDGIDQLVESLQARPLASAKPRGRQASRAKSATAAKPVNAAKPVKAAKPVNAAKPVKAGKATKPAKPANPTKPTNAAKHAKATAATKPKKLTRAPKPRR